MAYNVIIDNIVLLPGDPLSVLEEKLRQQYGIHGLEIVRILRRSLDARKKNSIVYRYRVLVSVPDNSAVLLLRNPECSPYHQPQVLEFPSIPHDVRIPVIGAGPAGLFCALALSESGIASDIYERGRPVEQRMKDIHELKIRGDLDSESNVLFGEGGAGTYSDGKLVSRSASPESRWFFSKMVELGAPPRILYDAKPHVGTDLLVPILKNLRKLLEKRGCLFHFNSRLSDVTIHEERLKSFKIGDDMMNADPFMVLATGHSARDVYKLLSRKGVFLQSKGFAAGIRVEHPVELINSIQYGAGWEKLGLPAAEYRLTWKDGKTGKGVYSFCMCPGGEIINSSSEPAMLCTNGMSHSQRAGTHSNAAIVVTVQPGDAGGDPLAGIEFQRMLESKAFQAGGGGFTAPAMALPDFVNKRRSQAAVPSTYAPAVNATDLSSIFPGWMHQALSSGIKNFDKKMKGFYSSEGVCVGVETRTSSPVRITRDENFQSINCRGLMPVGEGAGYAGGIVSSAVDGIRAAKKIIAYYEEM